LIELEDFPHLNAGLNATSTVLLVTGYGLIKSGRYRAHAVMMILASLISATFLACYLIYHYNFGEKSTAAMTWLPTWLRTVYLLILFPHLLLAMFTLPMIGITLYRAYKRQWDKHRRIGTITFWIWLYVSVTGVIIYWMLYHLFPSMKGS
jgi:uncharacterized membrane protein YozB (DUF420 family)